MVCDKAEQQAAREELATPLVDQPGPPYEH